MAIGGYSMAILVLEAGLSFWLALPLAVLITMLFGVIIGLPSLRLRADYFAIVTLAMAEVVRLSPRTPAASPAATKASSATRASRPPATRTPGARSRTRSSAVENFWARPRPLLPLLPRRSGPTVDIATVGLSYVQRTPGAGCCGRSARTRTRPARSARTPSSTSSSRWRSPRASAPSPASSSPSSWHDPPDDFEPIVTFFAFGVLMLGGLASYRGVAFGAILFWALLEGTRFVELPITRYEKIAALRLAIVGLVLIGLMAFRPQGMFGKKRGDGPWRVTRARPLRSQVPLLKSRRRQRFGGIHAVTAPASSVAEGSRSRR